MKNEKQNQQGRRNFIKNATLTSAGVLGTGSILANDENFLTKGLQIQIPKNMTILFQGDSITDGGRNKSDYYPNKDWGMGHGYVYQIVSQLLAENPASNLRCYNRGISGHKVFQLANRWVDDCLQLEPDVLSILIGVNDFWHTIDFDYEGTAKTYEEDFKKLLDGTLKELPNVKLMICEPFVVKNGSAIKEEKWFPAFAAYQTAAQKIATDYKTHWVPFQKVFDDALKLAPVDVWCPDGVHPSMAGCHLMAKAWLEVFEKAMKG